MSSLLLPFEEIHQDSLPGRPDGPPTAGCACASSSYLLPATLGNSCCVTQQRFKQQTKSSHLPKCRLGRWLTKESTCQPSIMPTREESLAPKEKVGRGGSRPLVSELERQRGKPRGKVARGSSQISEFWVQHKGQRPREIPGVSLQPPPQEPHVSASAHHRHK